MTTTQKSAMLNFHLRVFKAAKQLGNELLAHQAMEQYYKLSEKQPKD